MEIAAYVFFMRFRPISSGKLHIGTSDFNFYYRMNTLVKYLGYLRIWFFIFIFKES